MPAAFPKSRGRFDNYLYVCFPAVLSASPTADVPWPWQLSTALTGRSLTQGWGQVRAKSGQRWNLPSFRHKQQRLYGAAPKCWVKLLCFGLFWKGNHNGGIWQLPSRAPPGPLGPRRAALAFVWRRPEEAHTAPRPKNAPPAWIFPFNSLRPLWEGVSYNVGERLHRLPFCGSPCCDSSFVQAVAVC